MINACSNKEKSSSGVHDVELTSKAGRSGRKVGKNVPSEEWVDVSVSSDNDFVESWYGVRHVKGVDRGYSQLGKKPERSSGFRDGDNLLNSLK